MKCRREKSEIEKARKERSRSSKKHNELYSGVSQGQRSLPALHLCPKRAAHSMKIWATCFVLISSINFAESDHFFYLAKCNSKYIIMCSPCPLARAQQSKGFPEPTAISIKLYEPLANPQPVLVYLATKQGITKMLSETFIRQYCKNELYSV